MAQSLAKLDISLPKGKEIQHVFIRTDDLFYYSDGKHHSTSELGSQKSTAITSYNYSNTLDLNSYSASTNGSAPSMVTYQLVNEYQGLLLYQTDSKIPTNPILLHFPDHLYNHSHKTINFNFYSSDLIIDVILQNGMLITMTIPLDFQIHSNDFFKIFYPFDFAARQPLQLFTISYNHQIVTLQDGGVLGLIKHFPKDCATELANDYEPVLFDNYSFFQSWSKRFFSFNRDQGKHVGSGSIACVHYLQNRKQLLTISNNMVLKLWDVASSGINFDIKVVQELNLLESFSDLTERDIHNNGYPISSLSDDQKDLVVYLPIKSGVFQTYKIDSSFSSSPSSTEGSRFLEKTKEFNSTMEYGSIWNVIDLKLSQNAQEVICMWKGNMDGFLQIYKDDEWINCETQSFQDCSQDIYASEDLSYSLLNLKSHYSNITQTKLQPYEEGKVPLDLETLRIIQTKCQKISKIQKEPSSLTLKNGSMIIVNNLHIYSHSVYVPTQTNVPSIKKNASTDKFTTIFNTFVEGLSCDFYHEISLKFLSKLVTNDLQNFVIEDLENFKKYIPVEKLDDLVRQLSSIENFTQVLQDIIASIQSENGTPSTSLLSYQDYDSSCLLENLSYKLSNINQTVLKMLVVFSVLEFDYLTLQTEIKQLLSIHYRSALFISLYKLDKSQLCEGLFNKYSTYGKGFSIKNYDSLTETTNFVSNKIINNEQFESIFSDFYISMINHKNSFQRMEFQNVVARPFSLVGNTNQQFLLALIYFKTGCHNESFEIFSNNFNKDLPSKFITSKQKTGLDKEFGTLINAKNVSEYYYELSKKYSENNEYHLSLKCIQKSIELYDMEKDDLTLKKRQTTQFLMVLDYFNMFEDILQVLINSNDVLDHDTKYKYYSNFIIENQSFIKDIIDFSFNKKIVIPLQDYEIIDKILTTMLLDNKYFKSYLIAYSFRISNENARHAVELLYEYIKTSASTDDDDCVVEETNTNVQTAKTLIINVLNSFKDDKERWFSTKQGLIVTLSDL